MNIYFWESHFNLYLLVRLFHHEILNFVHFYLQEEPYYTKQDLLFGFNYRMIIREYDEVVASAYTTCLTGYTYPDLMITPGQLQGRHFNYKLGKS